MPLFSSLFRLSPGRAARLKSLRHRGLSAAQCNVLIAAAAPVWDIMVIGGDFSLAASAREYFHSTRRTEFNVNALYQMCARARASRRDLGNARCSRDYRAIQSCRAIMFFFFFSEVYVRGRERYGRCSVGFLNYEFRGKIDFYRVNIVVIRFFF